MTEACIAETTRGRVRGHDNGRVLAFKGIPYARPPVGPLRFARPVPPPAWESCLDAVDFGPVSPQPHAPLETLLGAAHAPQSEALCLTLNVWTPGLDDARRPVMVWVHGGAFVTGSGSAPWYDGSSLAGSGDVVVVTFNYRLGALGFMYVGGPEGAAGPAGVGDGARPKGGGAQGGPALCNFGLLDQLAVLSWVRDNASAFGGDPKCVTAFGQSAGAMSIGTLLGSPGVSGLVRRAVLQSGACSHTMSVAAAARNSAVLLDRLGISPGSAGMLESLRSLPTEAFLAAQAGPLPERIDGLSFLPVVDGVTVPRDPLDSLAKGGAVGIDLLVGTNAEEMRLFTLSDPDLFSMDEEGLLARASQIWGSDKPDVVRRGVELYRRSRPQVPPGEVWGAISTDKVFRIPAIRVAETAAEVQAGAQAHSHGGSGGATFMYLFKWPTPVFDGAFGCCHGLEIPFVFDNLHQPGLAMVTGEAGQAGPGGGQQSSIAELRQLAGRMSGAWVSFARHGRPVVPDCETWWPYSPHASPAGSGGHEQGPDGSRGDEQGPAGSGGHPLRATMLFDITCSMTQDPEGDERRLWEGSL